MALTDLDGQLQVLATTDEKLRVVNFWAVWCKPCRNEMSGLESLSAKLDPDLYRIIGVSVDEDRYLAAEFLLSLGITFENLSDPNLQVSEAMLGVDVLPVTFIIAPDGEILHRITGERAWDTAEMQDLVQSSRR